MQRLTAVFLFLLATVTLKPANAQSGLAFSFSEKPGTYPVGLRVVEQYDRSRIFLPPTDTLGKPTQVERSRPLQTLVWYPAQSSTAATMKVGDYYALRPTEISFGHPRPTTGVEGWLFEGMQSAATQPMHAVRDASAAAGHFPVVIYAPSFSSTAWENADLCEYLASYGYIVLASPGMGDTTRESTHDVAGVRAQAADISFLIGYAQTLPSTDTTRVAVAGFSWGGLSNLFAAAHDDRIRALVALDGSMRYFPGLVQQAGDVLPDHMTIPLLYFKGEDSIEEQAALEGRFKSSGPNVLNAWTHGDLLSVQMLGLIHPEFSSMAHRNERFWQYEYANLQPADYDRADGIVGYGWVARYTVQFLDAYLKQDKVARDFLLRKPAENGVPKHTLSVAFRAGRPMPESFASFRAEVASKGFDAAPAVYAATQARQPGFKLDADAVTTWAYDLLNDSHTAEAIAIMTLAAQLDPSSQSDTSLGEMYARAGQKQQAIDSYRKALAKNSHNIIAEQSLKALEATTNH